MNAAIRCITLLVCVAICSASAVKYCRCIKTIQGVNLRSIADVKVHGPRPYCRKQEVIVILKNGRSHCLDPEVKFTRILVQRTQTPSMARAKNTMSPKSTTESDTASFTASATESTTASFTESAIVLPTSS